MNRRPMRAVGVEQRHAGQHQHDGADGEAQMRQPPDRRPAAVVHDRLTVAVLQRFGAHVRPVLVLLEVAVFAEEPQRRMRPEEREGATEQEQHELGGDPGVRIFVEVMRGGVRLEAQEAFRSVKMALLTGLQAVGRKDRRLRIVDALDRVIAVAIEALGGVGEAECVDLAMIRALVRRQLFLVATAAVFGDQELRLVEERILDVVRGVAVRADRRLRIALQQASAGRAPRSLYSASSAVWHEPQA